VPGVALTTVVLPVEEVVFRTAQFREWDVSEAGMGAFCARIAEGNSDMVGLPVFTSRLFRHSAIYVRRGAGIREPADLAGRRVGLPEWAMAAAVVVRGMLVEHHGINLRSIRWVQAGLHEPGRRDKTQSTLPAGLDYTPMPDKSLCGLLAEGVLDAVISSREPQMPEGSEVKLDPLFADLHAEESRSWRESGVFPIMHLLAMRRDTYERHRWIATGIVKACEEAKNRSLARMRDRTASFYPVPWLSHHLAQVRESMGENFWPYGLEPNRVTLDAFLRQAHEQGVTRRRVEPEELFAAETLAVSRT